MALSTGFTRLFGVRHPIASAPMGGSAGGALAAAVSRGGGFGMVGGGDRQWLNRELPIATDAGRPWGVGFLTWSITPDLVKQALAYAPSAVMLSFGDPTPFVEPVHAAGAALILQVTDLAEARQAVNLGADVIVAQGTEAGGHGARHGRSTLPFVPIVVDLAGSVPVLAAGGIADGRGIAAVLASGAAGALLGTRFQATVEALVDPAIVAAIVAGRGDETERSDVLDRVRGSHWPTRYTARTLRHPHLDRWRGREAELAAAPEATRDYQHDVERGGIPPLPVWAGEGIDLITDVPAAADLVAALAAQAEVALARAAQDNGPMIEKFNPPTVHEPAGYSHVTVSSAGRLVHLAGQCPLDLGGTLVGEPGDHAAQTEQVIANCLAVLRAAGATPADVVRSVSYVLSPDSAVLAAVWRQLTASALAPAFTSASTLLGVAALGYPGQLVEIDLTAALPA